MDALFLYVTEVQLCISTIYFLPSLYLIRLALLCLLYLSISFITLFPAIQSPRGHPLMHLLHVLPKMFFFLLCSTVKHLFYSTLLTPHLAIKFLWPLLFPSQMIFKVLDSNNRRGCQWSLHASHAFHFLKLCETTLINTP